MGGNLSLVAEFPDREPVILSGIAEDDPEPKATGLTGARLGFGPPRGDEVGKVAERKHAICAPMHLATRDGGRVSRFPGPLVASDG
jgi:hypothetical protein